MTKQNERYYVRFKGRILGPLALDKTLELVNRGQITRQHELSPDGVTWKLAREFPSLFGNQFESIDLNETPELAAQDLPREVWFAQIDGSSRGPVDQPGMKNWISLGIVAQDTRVWRHTFILG